MLDYRITIEIKKCIDFRNNLRKKHIIWTPYTKIIWAIKDRILFDNKNLPLLSKCGKQIGYQVNSELFGVSRPVITFTSKCTSTGWIFLDFGRIRATNLLSNNNRPNRTYLIPLICCIIILAIWSLVSNRSGYELTQFNNIP